MNILLLESSTCAGGRRRSAAQRYPPLRRKLLGAAAEVGLMTQPPLRGIGIVGAGEVLEARIVVVCDNSDGLTNDLRGSAARRAIYLALALQCSTGAKRFSHVLRGWHEHQRAGLP